MTWVTFDDAYVLTAMPTDVRKVYDAWLVANPGKSERLGAITGQVLADFRSGLAANPNTVLEDGETIPERCVPQALTIVLYNLMLEMGMSINMSAQTAFNNAQVYLRRLYASDEVVDGAAVSRTPSYVPGAERDPRMLQGV